jgi:hypothetical protein
MANKIIETVKFIFGMLLLLIPIIGGIVFYLEGFEVLKSFFAIGNLSIIWIPVQGASSTTPIFLGLCGIAGAYLMSNIRLKKE